MSAAKISNALNNKLNVNSELNKVKFEKNMIGLVGKLDHKKRWCSITSTEFKSHELSSVVEEKVNNVNDFETLIKNNKSSNLSAILKKKQHWCVVTSSSRYVTEIVYLNKDLKYKKVEPKKVEPKPEPKKVETKPEPKKVEPKKEEPKKVEPKKVEPKKEEPKKLPWRERQKLLKKN